jgi:hypothetical protein
LKQHDNRNDEQDYDYPKCKIPEIRIHLRSRYWLQGVLNSMLGSGSKDGDPKSPARLRLFPRLGPLQLRCNYGRQEQFSIIPNITPRWVDPAGETARSTL